MRRFFAVALLAGIGIALAQNPAYRQDARWRAPDEAAAKANPLIARPEAAAGGRKLFQHNCAECHGADGAGLEKKRSANFHLPVVQAQTDGILFWKITNGNASRGMPSFSKLPELQRWQLVLFIRSLKDSDPSRASQNDNADSRTR